MVKLTTRATSAAGGNGGEGPSRDVVEETHLGSTNGGDDPNNQLHVTSAPAAGQPSRNVTSAPAAPLPSSELTPKERLRLLREEKENARMNRKISKLEQQQER